MPGVTKHIYDHEIRDILEMWNKQLREISLILPQEYTEEDVISLVKNIILTSGCRWYISIITMKLKIDI